MKKTFICLTIVIFLFAGCGASLSDKYIYDYMQNQGLRVEAIESLDNTHRIVFIDSISEKGCFIVWGVDNNIGFYRITNVSNNRNIDSNNKIVVFRGHYENNEYICISILDQSIKDNVGSIFIHYPDFDIDQKVNTGQGFYVLTHPTKSIGLKLEKLQIYNKNRELLYEQYGETK